MAIISPFFIKVTQIQKPTSPKNRALTISEKVSCAFLMNWKNSVHTQLTTCQLLISLIWQIDINLTLILLVSSPNQRVRVRARAVESFWRESQYTLEPQTDLILLYAGSQF